MCFVKCINTMFKILKWGMKANKTTYMELFTLRHSDQRYDTSGLSLINSLTPNLLFEHKYI